MSVLIKSDRFHQAARDDYVDLLRQATRKDANQADEDGLTPTIYAAFSGNVEALRTLIGRGGDPDRTDYQGNSALHWAVMNGHLNCVSFLVNFGVNLWTLNNDFQTAKDVAALKHHSSNKNRKDILDMLDTVVAEQSALNPKAVQRAKEKAMQEAEKRIKSYEKLHKKAHKKAEREERQLKKKLFGSTSSLAAIINLNRNHLNNNQQQSENDSGGCNGGDLGSNAVGTIRSVNLSSKASLANFRRDSASLYEPTQSLKFSDFVTGTMTSKHRGFGAVSRKVIARKNCINNGQDTLSLTGSLADFKIREKNAGKCSVRSLTGLRRDNDVLFVRKGFNNNNGHCGGTDSGGSGSAKTSSPCSSIDSTGHARQSDAGGAIQHMRDLFTPFDDSASTLRIRRAHLNGGSNLLRASSEPDFINCLRSDSGLGDDYILAPEATGSIFERPGFGSVAFRHSLFNPKPVEIKRKGKPLPADIDSIKMRASGSTGSDSIGSAGSLAQRNASISTGSDRRTPWDEDPLIEDITIIDDDQTLRMKMEGSDKLSSLTGDSKDPPSPVLEPTPPMLLFLAAHGLIEYAKLFEEEKIDLDAIILLNEQDLKGLGLPLGPRRKLLSAIEKRRSILVEPGQLNDTVL